MTKTHAGRAALAGIAVLAASLGAAAAAELEAVKVGISNTSSDVGVFIAEKKGYFRDEGLAVTTIPFDSASKMVAPLGAGEVDAGTGSAAAGIFSAYARGIHLAIVADTASAPPGYGHNILLVRKDLMVSGRYRTFADFKGMKVALTAPGASSNSTMNEALKQFGLAFHDIEPIYLGYPAHVTALINKGVDAGLTAEPTATQAIAADAAVRITSDDVIDPYHQAAVVLYSAIFAHDRRDAANGYMRAYLRAVRFYNGALAGGKLEGPNAEEVIAILTQYTAIKDAAVYRAISPQGCNPDGYVNVASIKKDFEFYKTQGWIEGKVTAEQLIDNSFVDAALKALGPYRATAK
jgi:NitT/TauT family transport system substrate-binding protein